MSRIVDYYFSVASPWACLGHKPFHELAARHGLSINYKPVFLGQVFDQTGGLPLAKRHPARQRYRLMELQRWRDRRGVPLVLKPQHVPFDPTLADRCVIALVHRKADPAAFLGRVHAGIWEEQRNLADETVVNDLLRETGNAATDIVELAKSDATEVVYKLNLENAVEAGVFGAPSYVVDGEIFWGQDRLDLLDEMLTSGRAAYKAD